LLRGSSGINNQYDSNEIERAYIRAQASIWLEDSRVVQYNRRHYPCIVLELSLDNITTVPINMIELKFSLGVKARANIKVGELKLGVNIVVIEQCAVHGIVNLKYFYTVQRWNDTVINRKHRTIIRDGVGG
jgi:hypothetical protein